MPQQTVDYDALAKQYGATSSQPASQPAVDYDALAKQYGATESKPTPSAAGWYQGAVDVLKGAGKKAVETVDRITDATIRKIPGVNALDNVVAPIQVPLDPTNNAQRLGGVLEQVAEVAAPSRAISGLGVKAAETLAPRLTATIGERLATAAPRIAVEAAGNAGLAAMQGGSPLVGAALGAAAPAMSEAAKTIPASLRESAEKSVMQALGPTKERFKAMAAKISPEILRRGLVGSRESLAERAAQATEAAGQQIDQALTEFGARQVGVKPVVDALESAKDAFRTVRTMTPVEAIQQGFAVSGPQGLMLRKGAELAKDGSITLPVVFEPRALNQINQLQGVLKDLGDNARVDQLVAVRRAWDKVVADAGGFAHRAPGAIGQPLKDISEAATKRQATTAIRQLLDQTVPELTPLNKEYAFWKSLDDVLTQTMKRTAPHSEGLVGATKEAAGQVAGAAMHGGVGGAFALGKVAKMANAVFTSPRWRLASAQMKDQLAQAIANNDLSGITTTLARISAVEGAKIPAMAGQQ